MGLGIEAGLDRMRRITGKKVKNVVSVERKLEDTPHSGDEINGTNG